MKDSRRDHRPLPLASGASRLLVIAVFLSASLGAQMTDRALTESQARRASERLLALQREADALAAEQRTLLVDLRRLEVERSLKAEQLKHIESDAQEVARDLGNAGNDIDALEAEIAATRPALEARLVELYKLGGAGYMRLVLTVPDVKDFGRAYRMVAALATRDRQRIEQHDQNLTQLRAAHTALEQRRTDMTKLEHAAQTARAAADRAAAARLQLIGEIDRRRDLTAELASELQSAQARLQRTIDAINAGIPRQVTEGSDLPIRPFRGELEWPVPGRLLTPFRARATTVATASPENGVQLAAPEGAPVRAVHDGTVVFAGPFTGYGTLIILDHGALTYSLYGQLADAQVGRGAKVERGQSIGAAGRVLVGIPGMYFEMRVDGQPVNPLEWLKKRP